MKKIRVILLALFIIISTVGSVDMGVINAASSMSVKYAVHIQSYGDSQGFVKDGKTAGTVGEAKRLEAIKIQLVGNQYSGNVVYRTHVQSLGWQNWTSNGMENGSRGMSKRLEGIEIYLTGEIKKHYDITYRVQCQSIGWMPWVKNGRLAGTVGQGKRLEAIQIKLVPKTKVTSNGITYRTHCQTYGWLGWVKNGAKSGTTNEGKRLEAIQIKLTGNEYSGGVQYKTHVQTFGWEKNNALDGGTSGTLGLAKRLEAIEISLYGEVAAYYDIYYRVHAQTYGWLGWAKNGQKAGTAKLSKRLEAIEIRLVKKGSDVSGYSGKDPFVEGSDTNVKYKNDSTEANNVVALCNKYRRENGVYADLVMDPVLMKAAEVRANEILQVFSHTRPDGRPCRTILDENGYAWTYCGENIAAGQRDANSVMNSWMNSPGHRSNILDSGFKRIGVACIKVPGSEYGVYWVQIFSN